MAKFQSLLSYIVLSLVATAYAAIGPVADLTISNAQVSPDGFLRDAVVTNGLVPGPLITGNKASADACSPYDEANVVLSSGRPLPVERH